jgi:hypothetical protein
MFAEQLLLTLPPLLPEQEPLQPPVATVLGPVDYRTWRQRLERIDEVLNGSRVEEVFVRLCVQRRLSRPEPLCDGDCLLLQRMAATALRATIARTLTGDSYREFSTRLADSPLLQWFCRLSRLGAVQIPGKSHLQRYQEIVDESGLREVVGTLLESAAKSGRRVGTGRGGRVANAVSRLDLRGVEHSLPHRLNAAARLRPPLWIGSRWKLGKPRDVVVAIDGECGHDYCPFKVGSEIRGIEFRSHHVTRGTLSDNR